MCCRMSSSTGLSKSRFGPGLAAYDPRKVWDLSKRGLFGQPQERLKDASFLSCTDALLQPTAAWQSYSLGAPRS